MTTVTTMTIMEENMSDMSVLWENMSDNAVLWENMSDNAAQVKQWPLPITRLFKIVYMFTARFRGFMSVLRENMSDHVSSEGKYVRPCQFCGKICQTMPLKRSRGPPP